MQVEIYSWENRNHKYQKKKKHFNRINRKKMFLISAVKWKWGVWVWNNQLNIMHRLLQKPNSHSQLQLCGDQSFLWLISILSLFDLLKRVLFQKRGVRSKFLWLPSCFNELFRQFICKLYIIIRWLNNVTKIFITFRIPIFLSLI